MSTHYAPERPSRVEATLMRLVIAGVIAHRWLIIHKPNRRKP